MPVEPGTALAKTIERVFTTWFAYEGATQTLRSPRPDPSELLAACADLRAQMPDVDPATGALPWEMDPDLDPAPPEGPDWAGAAFEVLYEVHVLDRATSLTSQAYHLLELGNAIGSLSSWHPDYDDDHGQIVARTDR